MADIVVTVPRDLWHAWLAEGDLAGEAPSGKEHAFILRSVRPPIVPEERVYIAAHGLLRGWAPLARLVPMQGGSWGLVRSARAVACTIGETVPGFPGWRERWWSRAAERPFPDWQTAGLPGVDVPTYARGDAAPADHPDLFG
ncbi:MAG TPA: hypothetical protein VEB20_10385 [Azospirillaceae bacterium]|nr:hypothetical protein [Azospirillaceae bacterium]